MFEAADQTSILIILTRAFTCFHSCFAHALRSRQRCNICQFAQSYLKIFFFQLDWQMPYKDTNLVEFAKVTVFSALMHAAQIC